jgi:hypothetical protein
MAIKRGNIVWGNLWSPSGRAKGNIVWGTVWVGLGLYTLSGLAHMATTKGVISLSQSRANVQQQQKAAEESGWDKFFAPVEWAVSALTN